MKEKTFEELIYAKSRQIKPHYKSAKWLNELFTVEREHIIELMQQVREATIAEIESKANEYGEFGTADYVHEIPTDRIKLTEKN